MDPNDVHWRHPGKPWAGDKHIKDPGRSQGGPIEAPERYIWESPGRPLGSTWETPGRPLGDPLADPLTRELVAPDVEGRERVESEESVAVRRRDVVVVQVERPARNNATLPCWPVARE